MRITKGHADRPVNVRRFAGRRVVEKVYLAANGAEVYEAMCDLWNSPFGATRRPNAMPEPLIYRENSLIMTIIAGDAVGFRGDPGRSDELADECARVLADLHASGVAVPRIRDAARLVRSVERKADVLDAAGSPVRIRFRATVNRLRDHAPRNETLVVSHGDFSPRNLLVADSGPVLIDFDRLQMASPARDVSYWTAWRWATDLMTGRFADWSVSNGFVNAYRSRADHSAVESLAAGTSFHRAAALLRIAEGWSVLRERPDVALAIIDEAERQLTIR